MYADFTSRTVNMTMNEAKAAGKIGTDEFKELQEYLTAFPGFAVEIKATAKRKNDFAWIDYDYMRKHISNCTRPDKEQIMNDFKDLIAQDKKDKKEGAEHLEAESFFKVKKWFMATFPEIKQAQDDRREQIDKILSKVA